MLRGLDSDEEQWTTDSMDVQPRRLSHQAEFRLDPKPKATTRSTSIIVDGARHVQCQVGHLCFQESKSARHRGLYVQLGGGCKGCEA